MKFDVYIVHVESGQKEKADALQTVMVLMINDRILIK